MNNINTLIANLHSAVCEPEKEIKALQKQLDELKASIPKIKADAVRGYGEYLIQVIPEDGFAEDVLRSLNNVAKRYANQLEGKE